MISFCFTVAKMSNQQRYLIRMEVNGRLRKGSDGAIPKMQRKVKTELIKEAVRFQSQPEASMQDCQNTCLP